MSIFRKYQPCTILSRFVLFCQISGLCSYKLFHVKKCISCEIKLSPSMFNIGRTELSCFSYPVSRLLFIQVYPLIQSAWRISVDTTQLYWKGMLFVLNHDFPLFVSWNIAKFCRSIRFGLTTLILSKLATLTYPLCFKKETLRASFKIFLSWF